jgi:hypothetical protein
VLRASVHAVIETVFATSWGVEPRGAAQAATFAGSFLLAVVAVALMWLRERR